ncbi:carbamate kinase [Pseudomonas frederiksbergensis]
MIAHGNGPQVGLLSLQAAAYPQVSAFIDFGIPTQKAIIQPPDDMEKLGFAAGSMGPKVQAACEFARHTGKTAVIGSLSDIETIPIPEVKRFARSRSRPRSLALTCNSMR